MSLSPSPSYNLDKLRSLCIAASMDELLSLIYAEILTYLGFSNLQKTPYD
jgi:hypothetical protein